MNKRQYFYLISGLPDLQITDEHLPFTARLFLDELQDKIHPDDLKLIRTLYYSRDNRNLLDLLFNKTGKTFLEGNYSPEYLKEAITGSVPLPVYMDRFLLIFNERRNRYSKFEWESKLTEAYFRFAMNSGNGFLSQWMEFELNLKNSLLFLQNKHALLEFSEFIIEASELSKLFRQADIKTLSAEPSLGFFNAILKIQEITNLVEREKRIEMLRWKQVEEMTFFDYFTVEAILKFIIKLMILERWVNLKNKEQSNSLSTLLKNITGEVNEHK